MPLDNLERPFNMRSRREFELEVELGEIIKVIKSLIETLQKLGWKKESIVLNIHINTGIPKPKVTEIYEKYMES